MSQVLDLRSADRLFYGAQEAQSLYYGATQLWSLSGGLSPVLAIFSGQSNMIAAGVVQPPADRYAALPNVYMLNNTTQTFEAYVPDVNGDQSEDNTPTPWGPEAQFAYLFSQAFPGRPLYIVKVAKGGSSIEGVGPQDWSPQSNNELFSTLESLVAVARTLVPSGYTTVNMWNQGEAEAKDADKTSRYSQSWADFFTGYRARIDAGTFIKVRLRPYTDDPLSNVYQVREVDEAWQAQTSNAHLIDSDFERSSWGFLHPGTSWVDGLGDRAFSIFTGALSSPSDAETSLVAFDPVSDAQTSTEYTASGAEISDMDLGAPISVSGGEYRVLNHDGSVYTDWTSVPSIIHPYQSPEVRLLSSSAGETTTTMNISIGTGISSFAVTTAAVAVGLAPSNTTAPVITGTLTEGETLSVSSGVWDNAPTSLAYSWTRDGVPISGATGTTYVLTASDVGFDVDCDVTATNDNGSSTTTALGGTVAAGVPVSTYPGGIADVASGAWYDFQDAATYTAASGQPLSLVLDKSPNGRDLVGVSPPTLDVLNGHPAASSINTHWDDASTLHDVFTGATWSFSHFLLGNPGRTAVLLALDGAGGDSVWLGWRSNGNLRLYSSDGNFDLPAATGVAEALTWNYDGSELTVYRNGVALSGAVTAALGNLVFDTSSVGGAGGSFLLRNFLIGEMIAVPRSLTAQEIADLHSYLGGKWSV